MRYKPLDNSFYTRNRKRVVGEMAPNSVAILVSHDEYPRCGDTTHPFRQNSDLLYPRGIPTQTTERFSSSRIPLPRRLSGSATG